jgi:hypothetical protein
MDCSFLLPETALSGGMGRKCLWHAHVDIKGDNPLSKQETEVLGNLQAEVLRRYGLRVNNDPFNRLLAHKLAEVLGTKGAHLADLLADDAIYGAPRAHWTIMANHPEGSPEAEDFRQAYIYLADGVEALARPTYIEVERVRFQNLKPSGQGQVAGGDYQAFPIEPFQFVPVESLGRTFRDSEVHISFADMSLVDPLVLEDLFGRVGFRTAYRYYEETGEASIIATAQGFEPDMSLLYIRALSWANGLLEQGLVRCDVRLKWEEIIWHKLMNNPEVMPAIVPGSLISGEKK